MPPRIVTPHSCHKTPRIVTPHSCHMTAAADTRHQIPFEREPREGTFTHTRGGHTPTTLRDTVMFLHVSAPCTPGPVEVLYQGGSTPPSPLRLPLRLGSNAFCLTSYIARAPSPRLLATASEAARAVALGACLVVVVDVAVGHPLGALVLLSTRRPEGRVARRACLIRRIWRVVHGRGVAGAGRRLGGAWAGRGGAEGGAGTRQGSQRCGGGAGTWCGGLVRG